MTADEKDILLICSPLRGSPVLPDNRIGTCDVCGGLVQYRPHALPSIKRCVPCAAETVPPDAEIVLSMASVEELRALWRKYRQ